MSGDGLRVESGHENEMLAFDSAPYYKPPLLSPQAHCIMRITRGGRVGQTVSSKSSVTHRIRDDPAIKQFSAGPAPNATASLTVAASLFPSGCESGGESVGFGASSTPSPINRGDRPSQAWKASLFMATNASRHLHVGPKHARQERPRKRKDI